MAQTVVLLTGTTQPFLAYSPKGKILQVYFIFTPGIQRFVNFCIGEQKQSQFFLKRATYQHFLEGLI